MGHSQTHTWLAFLYSAEPPAEGKCHLRALSPPSSSNQGNLQSCAQTKPNRVTHIRLYPPQVTLCHTDKDKQDSMHLFIISEALLKHQPLRIIAHMHALKGYILRNALLDSGVVLQTITDNSYTDLVVPFPAPTDCMVCILLLLEPWCSLLLLGPWWTK